MPPDHVVFRLITPSNRIVHPDRVNFNNETGFFTVSFGVSGDHWKRLGWTAIYRDML